MRPARPRGTKAAPLTTACQQDLLLAGLTSQAQQPMGQETAREISVNLALHISWQALGIGVVVERGEKRFQMCRAHVVDTTWKVIREIWGAQKVLFFEINRLWKRP